MSGQSLCEGPCEAASGLGSFAAPINIEKGIFRLDSDWSPTASGTTGLNLARVFKNNKWADPEVENGVLDYLNSLNFGEHTPNFWDCEDRAIWGVAHVRRRFPGYPIGIAEGKNENDEDHARIILWHKKSDTDFGFKYYEPLQKSIVDFKGIARIIAFPAADPANINEKDTLEPFRKLGLARFEKKKFITFDEEYIIYPTRTDDGKGVLDYLDNKAYDKVCHDIHAHETTDASALRNYFRDFDRSFWIQAHVRRSYPGCPIGVAVGKPINGKAYAVNILWYREGNSKDGELKFLYWDSYPLSTERIVKFDAINYFV